MCDQKQINKQINTTGYLIQSNLPLANKDWKSDRSADIVLNMSVMENKGENNK